ncbi:hypothetical protein QBC38DRAFT_514842 [Podospora fimiseda]|uniref:Uncharacterized protein n=1 Tax=Podospora fimiseda TaxID=252190 RepID=A0AAN7BJ78_9PEZI|nr:hypothetical protein QBC38DRAFT_514842 [Podospora fimiseda]
MPPHPFTTDLFVDAGHYLWQVGDLGRAIAFLKTADNICRSCDPSRQREAPVLALRASVLTFLIAVKHKHGFGVHNNRILLSQREEVVCLRDEVLKELQISIPSVHDLGYTCLEMSEFDMAKKHSDCSFTGKRLLCAETDMPFEFATEYGDRAYVRLGKGRYDEALELLQEAIQVVSYDKGANLTSILQFEFDRSVVLLNAGKYDQAFLVAAESYKNPTDGKPLASARSRLSTRITGSQIASHISMIDLRNLSKSKI